VRLGTAALIAISVSATNVAVGQPGPQLFRVRHNTYGCANPRATRVLTNREDPRQADPDWVAFVVDDGHCVAITPRSQWRLVFRDGDLAFMTYAGNTAAPGSFYVRLDELSGPIQSAIAEPDAAAPPATPVEPIRPAITAVPLVAPVQPTPQPKAEPTPEPSKPLLQAPEAKTTRDEVSSPLPSRPAPAPQVAIAPPSGLDHAGSSQPGGSGGVFFVAVGIAALIWLAGRGKRAKKAKTSPRQTPRPAARTTPPAHLRPMAWVRGDQPVAIGGVSVPGHMIYVGGPPLGGAPPPCLVDPTLPIAPRSPETAGKGMPYWPSYSAIGPNCRLAYLHWLRDGRKDPAVYIGYVFLFLYGLERRAFVDQAHAREMAELVAEVQRLLSIYGTNNSFRGYATGFVAAAELRALVEMKFDAGSYKAVLDGPPHQMPIALKLAIATKVAAGQPLSFELAMAGLLGLPSDALPVGGRVLEHARAQFLHLMRRRFDDCCPLGYKLPDRKGPRLELRHRCATAGLTVDLAPQPLGRQLPDPSALGWDKLAAMAAQVAAELDGFANLKQRHPERARTLSALAALPEGFAAEAVGPAATNARRWLEALPKPISRVGFADLAAHALGERGAKWTLRNHRAIHEALAATEYGLEPHPEDGSVSISDDTPMYVFPDSGSRRDRTPSYAVAALGADIVDAVSRADPTTAAAVRTGWLTDVGSRMSLSDPELVRLDARLRSLEHSAPSTASRIAKRSDGVSAADRATVAKLAAEGAAAAGAMAKGQVALLEKIYDEFGLERGGLYSAIHAPSPERIAAAPPDRPVSPPPAQDREEHGADATGATARLAPGDRPTQHGVAVPATGPVLVSRASPETVHRIPPPPPVVTPAPPAASPLPPANVAPPMGVLDPERIKRIQAETRRVSSVLAPIFSETEATPTAPAPAASDGALAGLGAPYAALLRRLATKAAWSRTEFEAAVHQGGLLPDGAMEAINEWAFDRFDAPLLDDGDTITLDLALLTGTGIITHEH